MSEIITRATEKSQHRYRDGYRLAGTIDFWGYILKIIGCLLGIGATFLVVAIVLAGGGRQAGVSEGGAFFLGVLVGVPIGVIVWVLGVVVQAHAQLMKASLDSAVCGNVFLSPEQKAMGMFPSLQSK